MRKKVTMQEIADMLGISKVTVSKAINRREGVSDALREKILSTARALNYSKPGRTANHSRNFAFVCPKRFFLEDDAFYTSIYYYLNKQCIQDNDTLDLYVVGTSDERFAKLPRRFENAMIDGVFIAGQFQDAFLAKLLALPQAKVALDFYVSDLSIDAVISDNFRMGTLVTDYLISRGHRKIGFVGDPLSTSSISDRYFGYRKAMKLAGCPVEEAWGIINNDPFTGSYNNNMPLPADLPSAYVCHCDKAAFVLTQQLEKAGLQVPEDVSIVSFDNTNYAKLMHPQLTSVVFDQRGIALTGKQVMADRLIQPDSLPHVHYTQSKLIIRDSVKDNIKQD
mgnify:FL=1